MHIPDGILPVWLWLTGFVLMAWALAFALYRLRGMDRKKKIPLLGVLAASMLVAMNLEVLPLAYHLNLSVAAGILLGPALGFVAALLVNLMLALIGHGGITVMGLNTLLLGAEAALGHTLFFLLPKRLSVFWRAALATAGALFLVSLFLIAIVGTSHVDVDVFAGHEHGGETTEHKEGGTSLAAFAFMVLGLGALGWIIESAITGAVIRFLSQVRPDLLAHRLHAVAGCSTAGKDAP
ncbi:MAG: energy-coupling factor ABC transporter permease [Nitrospirota bacterium]|nr:energy-coupling factor ABC transporter permease [Nitrospirota bacterium]